MRSRGEDERERIARRVRELLDTGARRGRADDRQAVPVEGQHGSAGPLVWNAVEDVEVAGDAVAGGPHDESSPVLSSPGPSPPGGRVRRFRVDPGSRGVLAVACCAVLAAVLTVLWVRASGARSADIPMAASTAGSVVGSSAPVGSAGSACVVSTSASVVVDVAGKVRRPGVYTLPASARVIDAIKAAGGAEPAVSLAALNLAARVTDGQQISVGVPGAAQTAGVPAGSTTGQAGAPGTGPVDLNTASLDQLETLPGVGPVLAQHILDWRTEHGRFASVDQLQQVSGIGDVKYAALKGLVTV